MSVDFTLPGYADLLQRLTVLGYRAARFQDAAPGRHVLVLRHDLDMSLASAVRMAEVEAQAGIAATYFVMVRSGIYNPFDRDGAAGMRRLLALGHEIGLHIDFSLYGTGDAEIDAGCAAECALLEAWLGKAVEVVSFHRPGQGLLALDRSIAGRMHTYQPRFFREMEYCSDSRGGWHHGHPLDRDAVKEGRALHLMTHPVWWDAPGGETPGERVARFAAEREEFYRRELAHNSRPYAEALARR